LLKFVTVDRVREANLEPSLVKIRPRDFLGQMDKKRPLYATVFFKLSSTDEDTWIDFDA